MRLRYLVLGAPASVVWLVFFTVRPVSAIVVLLVAIAWGDHYPASHRGQAASGRGSGRPEPRRMRDSPRRRPLPFGISSEEVEEAESVAESAVSAPSGQEWKICRWKPVDFPPFT